MPAPNTTKNTGDTKNINIKSLWKNFCKENNIELDYNTFRSVIDTSNLRIQNYIINNTSGFKFPEAMGYSIISMYKPKGKGTLSIDWIKTKEVGKLVYYTNFHSNGLKGKIQWITSYLAKCRNLALYKFIPERKFMRSTAKEIQEGKFYLQKGFEQFKPFIVKVKKFKNINGK